MAKFNKDTFLNSVVNRVQNALNKGLLTQEDVQSNNLERLHGFIQYELIEYISDRKYAIDVLKDFNYDLMIKSIKEGDTQIQYAVGHGEDTPENRFDTFVRQLERGYDKWITPYRRLRWN